MNIEPDIFDYLQTTALEPHDDYASEITYKDQKIIWNRLKQQEKQLNKQKEVLNKIKETINYYAIENEDYSKIYNQEEQDILKLLEEIE